MTDALLGLAAGLAAGAVMTRWGLCFNRALRRAVFEQRPALVRAFGVAVAVQLLLLPLLIAAGVGAVERGADAGGPALLPVAQVAGGLVFGAGMALAGGCVTGMLWKAGAGALALGIAIAGFAAGELLIRGPGDGLIERLDDASQPAEHALPGLLDASYSPVALAVGAIALATLLARRRAGGLIAGAALGERRLRRPDLARAGRAAVGGLLMGAGGSLAHGCNIGHGLTGLSLLSFGSLLATACMAAGALLTWRLLLAPRPALRGRESLVAQG